MLKTQLKTHRLVVKVQIDVHQEAEDSYVATCPQLGCIFVHEETEEAALRYVREAIESYMLTCIEHGDPLPEDVVVSRQLTSPATPSSRPKVAAAPAGFQMGPYLAL